MTAMLVGAEDLQPGDRFAGRVVVEVEDEPPWAKWAVQVTTKPIGSAEALGYGSSFPKGMLLEVERPPKKWRVTLEFGDDPFLLDYWRNRYDEPSKYVYDSVTIEEIER